MLRLLISLNSLFAAVDTLASLENFILFFNPFAAVDTLANKENNPIKLSQYKYILLVTPLSQRFYDIELYTRLRDFVWFLKGNRFNLIIKLF